MCWSWVVFYFPCFVAKINKFLYFNVIKEMTGLAILNFFFLTLFAKKNSSLTPFENFFPKWPTFIFGFFFFLSFSPFPPFQMARLNVCLSRVQPSQADVIGQFFLKFFFSFPPFRLAGLTFFFVFFRHNIYIYLK